MTKFREIATIIYYNDQHNVYLQERGSMSKYGEKYAIWGGGLNPGETPFTALQREMMEEIGHQQNEAEYFKFFIFNLPKFDLQLKIHVFYTPLDFDPKSITVTEGTGFFSIPITKINDYPDFPTEVITVLQEFKKFKHW